MRLTCLLLLLVVMEGRGAFEPVAQGARSAALSGARVSLCAEPWALFLNPAAAATLSKATVALYHMPGLFGVPEIARTSFSALVPQPWGTVSVAGSRFGFPLYHESTLLLGYALPLAQGLFAGCAVSWNVVSIAGYGSAHCVAIHAGMQSELCQALVYGFSVTNINTPPVGATGEHLPLQVCTGASYAPFEGSMLIVETEKVSGYPLDIHVAIECAPMAPLVLRGGFTTESWSTGIGVVLVPLLLDYAVTCHPDLGLTHHVSVSLGIL